MLHTKRLYVGLMLVFTMTRVVLGQSVSPDHHWTINYVEKPIPYPSAKSGSTDRCLVISRLNQGVPEMFLDDGGDHRWGPTAGDLTNIKWNSNSNAFTAPIHGKRFEGFTVYALTKGKWIEAALDDKYELMVRQFWKITDDEDWGESAHESSMTPLEWRPGGVLKWDYNRGGYEADVFHRLTRKDGNPVMNAVSVEEVPQIEVDERAFNPKSDYRFIHVHVLNPKGDPVAARYVHLLAVAPHELLIRWGSSNATSSEPPWASQTNEAGRFTGFLSEQSENGTSQPGPGQFRYVVANSPDDAGGISTPFTNPTDLPAPQPELAHREFSRAIQARGLDLTIKTVPGFTIQGSIVDLSHPEQPIADGVAWSWVYGGTAGEIPSLFFHQVKGDAKGNFSLPHCFPDKNRLIICLLRTPNTYAWVGTEVNGQTVDNVIADITPSSPTGVVTVKAFVRTEPEFRYYGRLTDQKGAPVPQGGIYFRASLGSVDVDPSQGTEYSTKTNDLGFYEIKTFQPWVKSMHAAPRVGQNMDMVGDERTASDNSSFPPGEYNFQIK